ncbi:MULTISPECIES: NADPH-dependent FMN reductase [unclassified Serratia (in: enterobacteria)]|uniref:NADPH-dependent FMN reductase n=1 Tax=unclassified Serratia (in: enterobacteria) TaxID=2647522 RepID=UPI0030763BEE
MTIRILAFCGSNRRESLNQQLLKLAVQGAVDAGAEVTVVRLAEFQLPIYDGDEELEHGLPKGAIELQELIAQHDALLIATPEYNGGYTALLKNAIDWISRPQVNGSLGTTLFAGKVAALVSASPGLLGGLRSQMGMRTVLDKLGVLVIPNSFALGSAHQAFDDEGQLHDITAQRHVLAVGAALAQTVAKFVN